MAEYIDWDNLTPEDQANAERLLGELNKLLDKYEQAEEEKPCDDFTSEG